MDQNISQFLTDDLQIATQVAFTLIFVYLIAGLFYFSMYKRNTCDFACECLFFKVLLVLSISALNIVSIVLLYVDSNCKRNMKAYFVFEGLSIANIFFYVFFFFLLYGHYDGNSFGAYGYDYDEYYYSLPEIFGTILVIFGLLFSKK
ncbi:MAG: hypothetical protein MJ252_14655, partial [archaeon]|nr:hypothetical protein [archaeon]